MMIYSYAKVSAINRLKFNELMGTCLSGLYDDRN